MATSDSHLFNRCFLRVRRGEAPLEANAVGAEEAFGEIKALQLFGGDRANYGGSGALYRAAQ